MTPFLPMVFLSRNKHDPLELSIFCTYDDIWVWIDNYLKKNSSITNQNSNTYRFESINELEKFSTLFTLKWFNRLTPVPKSKNANFTL